MAGKKTSTPEATCSFCGRPRSAAQADIPITVNAAANHVTFYYKVREGIAVTIRFLNEAGENIATPIVRTGETTSYANVILRAGVNF